MTVSQQTDALHSFQWKPQPVAEKLVLGLVRDFLRQCPPAAELADRMRDQTGTRFIDWIDSIHLPQSDALAGKLTDAGFCEQGGGERAATRLFTHAQGMFPRILLDSQVATRVFIKVESVADFLAATSASREPCMIDGRPLGHMRQTQIAATPQAELWIVERHGYRAFTPPRYEASKAIAAQECLESFRRRRREFDNDADGLRNLHRLIGDVLTQIDLDVDWLADLFFTAEREYWQRRNRAAQVQKSRQDRLGLGWANHDHHTYRSSRDNFAALVAAFEKLGFTCRERFYAGAEAGWGAQILEQPNTGIVIFADVDLSPEELANDFAHEGLQPRQQLGTVGLWCALHGQAILQAGMHHLECQFDFEALSRQLEADGGVHMMKPFTNFPYLRQAFTDGEIWPVNEGRIDKLLTARQITPEQAQQFREKGAIGSHLENLERNQGFKGFNQTGVSDIISRTDPRKQKI